MPDFIRQPERALQEGAPERQREYAETGAAVDVAPVDRQESQAPMVRPQVPVAQPVAQTIAPQDAVLKSVEDILADGLMDLYATFPEDRKATFREKGEQTARKIRDMIVAGRTKVLDVLRLIRSWLHTIPGVSSFFLEQEAKIKTDRILGYSDAYRTSQP